MRPFLVLIASVLLGVAIGAASTVPQWTATNDFGALTHPEVQRVNATNQPMAKAVVVGDEVYEFGKMNVDATQSHVFKIRNDGDAPLQLEEAGTTCKCTLSKLAQKLIPPGETVEVELEWHPIAYAESFMQTATLRTNDPRRPELELRIHGAVVRAIYMDPSEVNFGHVTAGDELSASVNVVSVVSDDFKVTGVKLLGDESGEATAKVVPMSPEELKSTDGGRSGDKVEIYLPKGLPIGATKMRAEISTNDPETKMLTLMISVQIGGDINFISAVKIDQDKNVMMLGTVSGEKGKEVKVNVLVKGPHREETVLNVDKVFPEFLKVSLGEAKKLNETAVVYPMTITIPPGSAPASFLAGDTGKLGEIRLGVKGNPQTEEVSLRVYFAVE
ncbi:DUF1573 domain-containing protein [Blastopirellula sp. JC732]|uniref:DUF1573 domain-containing protein n=1 Tax=Blastopirellula sediminis TaxID=2894196 RepID=A0A9X1MNW8_9BACT|nr:DUF1573 domain-containing protein [Blastopirellula sediminis]MCC9605933.1 DUF1573 domain-containing protein [Blastopirellula sediminis]MCC9630768.1 DUF1573 domain-containing protein [Blastopirellula sediminis]